MCVSCTRIGSPEKWLKRGKSYFSLVLARGEDLQFHNSELMAMMCCCLGSTSTTNDVEQVLKWFMCENSNRKLYFFSFLPPHPRLHLQVLGTKQTGSRRKPLTHHLI